MRAIFIGCVDSSWHMLETLLECKGIDIVGVVTRSHSSSNADFRSLEPLAVQAGIPGFIMDGHDQSHLATWMSEKKPDICFCLGWSYLLERQVLNVPSLGVIGYHPAMLPRNRGRHPIIWALALGLESTGSTFFYMDEGADSGDIVSQRRIPISYDDDADSLYCRVVETASDQLRGIAEQLMRDVLVRRPQDATAASYWRKRDRHDGEIDWRMPAEGIRNLVRALTHPYAGAHCVYGGQERKVWKVEVSASTAADIEPGRVLDVDGMTFVVKAGVDAVRLLHHDFEQPPKRGTCLA